MKYIAAVLALSTGALAQLSATDSLAASVLSVLATAIPPDSISIAIASPDAFASSLASSFAAGQTPEWYQALPSDVKSVLPQLYPVSTPAETTASSTAESASSSAEETSAPVTSVIGTVSSAPTGGNSTVISTVQSPTLSPSSTGGDGAPSSSGSTGGAAYPTAVVGAGIAGAIGFLGMLAL